jgi:hypothetical protein
MTAPFKSTQSINQPGDRIRLKANHAIEAELLAAPTTLEPGMVVETSTGVYVIQQPGSWAGSPIIRVGRVEWIWERDDAN